HAHAHTGRPAIVVQHHHRRPPASDVGRREGEGERRQEGWSPGPGRGTTVRQEAARHGRLRPRARARQIVTTLRHIKDKAHKDGQKKTEQAISSVTTEIQSMVQDTKTV
uniref:Uncharacterized protein n=2 Tax=Aegilops tauschii subsp. strangulata TaxID=200361 RepID=A0A453MEP2_AEGTS